MASDTSFNIASNYPNYSELVLYETLFVMPTSSNYVFTGGGMNYGQNAGNTFSVIFNSSNGNVTVRTCSGIVFWSGSYSFLVIIIP